MEYLRHHWLITFFEAEHLFISKFTAGSQKIRLWENSKKQFMLSLSIFCFLHFVTEISDTKNLLGSCGILSFLLTSTSKVSVAKKPDRSSLKESFNMEISLQSSKGVTKVTGGHLKLIRNKNMKEGCQVSTLRETASCLHEVQYFFLTNSAASCVQGLEAADLIPLKLTWKSLRFTLCSFLRGPNNCAPEILAKSVTPKCLKKNSNIPGNVLH